MPIDTQGILSYLGEAASSAKDGLAGAAGSIGDYVKSDDFKKLTPYLLAGGVGALGGGLATGGRREAKGEGRLGHLARVLGNAALAGGVSAGAYGLVDKGLESISGGASDHAEAEAEAKNLSPAHSATKSLAFSPFTAGAAGVGGAILGGPEGRIGKMFTTERSRDLKSGKLDNLFEKLKGKSYTVAGGPIALTKLEELKKRTPDQIAELIGSDSKLDKLRREVGLSSSGTTAGGAGKIIGGAQGKVSDAVGGGYRNFKDMLLKVRGKNPEAVDRLRRMGEAASKPGTTSSIKGILSMLRQNKGRLGVGAAAASVPAIIGALLTNKEE